MEIGHCLSEHKTATPLRALVFICLLFLLGAANAVGADGSELLRYEVTWNGSKAAHGDITTKRDSTNVSVKAQAVSDGLLKAMVEIWSRVQATFTARTFQPRQYVYQVKSNRLRSEVVNLSFDHKKKLVQVDKLLGDSKESHSEKFARLYDPITAVYLLRSQKDFSRPMFVDIYDGKDKARLFVTPAGTGKVRIRTGLHTAVHLRLRLAKLTGDKKEIATGQLWISNDKHRIPLLLTSSPGVGEIRFELVQAQL